MVGDGPMEEVVDFGGGHVEDRTTIGGALYYRRVYLLVMESQVEATRRRR